MIGNKLFSFSALNHEGDYCCCCHHYVRECKFLGSTLDHGLHMGAIFRHRVKNLCSI